MKRLLTLALLAVFFQQPLLAQCDGKPGPDGLTWDFEPAGKEGFSVWKFFNDLVTPQLLQDTRHIRAYVRDSRFAELRNRCRDLRAIDAIYIKALRITEYNVARALFLSMMAVLEHQNVDVKMPIAGALRLPLTFEEDSLFRARTANVPKKVYRDSPDDEHGDRDKLQHFFGSAYLAYASESPEFARSTGNVIEWGEARFVVGGVDDSRDKRANKQGEAFGRDLLVVKTLLPSDYLTLTVDEK